jgi:hypothetical protein
MQTRISGLGKCSESGRACMCEHRNAVLESQELTIYALPLCSGRCICHTPFVSSKSSKPGISKYRMLYRRIHSGFLFVFPPNYSPMLAAAASP